LKQAKTGQNIGWCVASLMNAGTQVKTAFLGVAAVDIGGSTLCKLFDIPTGRRNRKGGLEVLSKNAPGSEPGAGEKEKVESKVKGAGFGPFKATSKAEGGSEPGGAKKKVEGKRGSQGQRGRGSETVPPQVVTRMSALAAVEFSVQLPLLRCIMTRLVWVSEEWTF
jgi:hypothetical protein